MAAALTGLFPPVLTEVKLLVDFEKFFTYLGFGLILINFSRKVG